MSNSFLRQACTQPFLTRTLLELHLRAGCLENERRNNSGQPFQPALDWIMHSKRGRARVLEKNHPQKWFLDFSSPLSRLCLVQTNDLLRVADYLGLLLHATDIARQITRQAVGRVTERFGKQGYTFALRRCRTLSVSRQSVAILRNKLTRHVAEETDIVDRVTRHGQMLVADVLGENPPQLLERLNLPENLRPNEVFRLEAQEKEQAAALCYAILTREVAPQWAPYFP